MTLVGIESEATNQHKNNLAMQARISRFRIISALENSLTVEPVPIILYKSDHVHIDFGISYLNLLIDTIRLAAATSNLDEQDSVTGSASYTMQATVACTIELVAQIKPSNGSSEPMLTKLEEYGFYDCAIFEYIQSRVTGHHVIRQH